MDFGFVPPDQLAQVDFTLPPDGALTNSVLNGGRVSNPSIYVGCAKWGRKEWVGMIYPEKTREANFLDEYAKHFNSIELNAVFYNMPKKEQILSWKEKVATERANFKFCPKITRSISHIKRLKNADEDTHRYLESISEFGNYLGPVFLQLSDNFGPKNIPVLRDYLISLPKDLELFIEVRHKDWFEDHRANEALFTMLHELGKGAIITDASGRRDCVHMQLTTPSAFIRFVGNGLHPTDFQRIDEWVDRLNDWLNKGLKSVYFFLHQHDEKDTPVLADYTIKKINEKLGIGLETPKFINANKLFT
jgi:uncharacterized protein YecE (DUF72 family)